MISLEMACFSQLVLKSLLPELGYNLLIQSHVQKITIETIRGCEKHNTSNHRFITSNT
eukprot:m.471818 g.471818  ORF g.471818 m.471818 type:complete len:58 (+) comp21659_c0_seq16:2717-2890(+)